MAYPQTGSILNSQIHTGLSTQVTILVNNQPVGAVQSMQINQSRSIQRVGEVGLDGTLELVPNQIPTLDLTVDRIVFDKLRLPEAFARGFVNIKSQLVPFDILVLDRSGGGPDQQGVIKTQFVNCWFKTYNYTYKQGDFIIAENATIACEDIVSTLGNTSNPVAQGGERGIQYQINQRERLTDSGSGGAGVLGAGFRGTMDVDNLINQAFE